MYHVKFIKSTWTKRKKCMCMWACVSVLEREMAKSKTNILALEFVNSLSFSLPFYPCHLRNAARIPPKRFELRTRHIFINVWISLTNTHSCTHVRALTSTSVGWAACTRVRGGDINHSTCLVDFLVPNTRIHAYAYDLHVYSVLRSGFETLALALARPRVCCTIRVYK